MFKDWDMNIIIYLWALSKKDLGLNFAPPFLAAMD